MNRSWEGLAAAVCVAALAMGSDSVRAQGWQAIGQYSDLQRYPDYFEWTFAGGVRLWGGGLEIHADSAVLLLDSHTALNLRDSTGGGLPRRDIAPPTSRRIVSEAVLRRRLNSFLSSVQGTTAPTVPAASFPIGLLHTMFLEGNVVIMERGREVARAQKVHFSTTDDRVVLSEAELRFWPDEPGKPRVLVLRGDELVKQGSRTVGRNVSLTTCSAGEPHIEAKLGAIEITERGDDFEVRTHDGTIALSGVGFLPIPNTRFFAREQTYLPIKGASIGYSNRNGVDALVDLGGSFNDVGGAIHQYFTGRPVHEFRGDWHLGLGYIEERGFPIEGDLTYGADGQYRGRLDTFYLQDQGIIRREITRNLDNSRFGSERSMVRTENRLFLGEQTTLDLSVFHASDPAVRTEFYRREYREEERPETSAHFRHWADNRLFTATARADINGFSYDHDRSLASSFREELPLATFHWFSEPIAELPGDVPVLLTSAGSAGYLRNRFDDTLTTPDQDTLRLDEELELSTPFWIGAVGFRPFLSARVTHYDETMMGDSKTRWAFAGGVRAATHLSRAWTWLNDEGQARGIRHILSPAISFVDRFQVDGDPLDFYQFDETDSLDEEVSVRFELLNRMQRKVETETETSIDEFFWLDLAQTVTPISDRDNMGHHLGVFEYELIVTMPEPYSPFDDLRFVVEGEHDWSEREERTFNVGTRFGKVLGLDWGVEYRTDRNTDGSIFYGAGTQILGRWALTGRSQYDLQIDDTINYVARIIRNDHDWRLHLGLNYDNIDGETNFFVHFEPTVGGLFARRRGQFTGSVLDTEYGY